MSDHPSARARRGLPLLAVLLLTPVPADAGPRDPLYHWSDAEGMVRYTTDLEQIPPERRQDAVRVELPPEPEPPLPRLGAEEAPAEALPPVESSHEPAAPTPPSPLDARIAALEREIAADEATLTRHISDPERAARLATSDEIAAIAERLPRLQAELRALREKRRGEATER